MIIEIDFNSQEALYLQLRNQIVLGIATAKFQEGDTLPSVRQFNGAARKAAIPVIRLIRRQGGRQELPVKQILTGSFCRQPWRRTSPMTGTGAFPAALSNCRTGGSF